jgi:hypothetical protein
VGTRFLDPADLGPHAYRFNFWEKNGIVYTCKAGHVDIAHLRIGADWTAYLAAKTFECLMQDDTGFSFRLSVEPSRYFVRIMYPANWQDQPQEDKERIARDVSIKLGQYLAFSATTWHEILTWFGYRCIGVIPEFPSAFSWEDSFSNLLGTRLAASILQDPEADFDKEMTLAIDRELERLGAQSRHTARWAAEKMRGQWFSGQLLFLVDTKRRNLDIGLDDGRVSPTIVPDLSECKGAEVQSYPVPDLDFLSEYGFSVRLEIEPREWEKNKILRAAYPDGQNAGRRLEPAIHFARLMYHIQQDAVENHHYSIDPCLRFPFSEEVLAGDVNGDHKLDHEDFAVLALHWLNGDNP